MFEIVEVDENEMVSAVDIPLNKTPGVYPNFFDK